ncbi:MAG TPA: isocitrate lyase/PEP mutase family protein [Limnochorda sp.]
MLQPMAGPGRLRELLSQRRLLVAPGVYDGLSARIAEQAGFEVLYVSGGAIARSMGLPDVGLVTLTETAKRLEEIRSVTSVPLVVDADTGYGNELNVIRTVRALERAGAAAIHLEDQVTPKKCGHYDGHELIEAEAMARKIRAALDARQDPSLMVIARTDARSAVGLDEAIRRGRLYAEAGADMVFVEAPRSEAELERISRELAGIPLLVNMFHGGKTPLVPAQRLEAMGYRLMIVPSDLQRAAAWAMQRAARLLRERGDTAPLAGEMAGFAERDAMVGLPEIQALERRYLQGSSPP